MPDLTNHPLIVALGKKREYYLFNSRHAEAHGVSTALMIVWAFLNRRPLPESPQTAPVDLKD
jgi:hypothetical protein